MRRVPLLLLERAWRWWFAEFLALLPRAYLKRLTYPNMTLLLRSSEAMTEITVMAGEKRLMQHAIPQAGASEEVQSGLRDAIHAATKGKRAAVIGVIPDHQSLARSLTLPLAAKAHIEEATRYQIERLSPFKSENTLYCIKLLESGRGANALHFQLFIVSKALVVDIEERSARLGFSIDRFAIEAAGSGFLETLTFTSQVTAVTKLPLATKALLSASLVLIASFLLVPIVGKWKTMEALKREITLFKPKADQALKLRNERDKIIALRSQITDLKRAVQPPIAILSKLSELLDDQTFITELRMEGAFITMSGLSADASKLAQRLGAANSFKSVRFSGPVTRDAQAARDRFTLILEMAESS
jgi:general secretion pathway protein L